MIPEKVYNANELRIKQVMQETTDRIAGLLAQLDIDKAGNLKRTKQNLQRVKQMQKEILKDLTQGPFRDEMEKLVNTYGQVPNYVAEAMKSVRITPEFTEADTDLIRIMSNDTLNELAAMSNSWGADINSSVYGYAVAGGSRTDLIRNVRQRLMGEQGVGGRPLAPYAATIVNTRVAELNTVLLMKKGDEAGIEMYKYQGDVIGDTRPWCQQHVGQILTKDEIKEWAGQSWAGKKSGDPFVTRGGWNCRHSWGPVIEGINDSGKKQVIQSKEPKHQWAGSSLEEAKKVYSASSIDRMTDALKGVQAMSSGAHYSPYKRIIDMGKHSMDDVHGQAVYRHEFGHHIDFMLGPRPDEGWSGGAVFTKAMRKEGKTLATMTPDDFTLFEESNRFSLLTQAQREREMGKKLKALGVEFTDVENYLRQFPEYKNLPTISMEQWVFRILHTLESGDAAGFMKFAHGHQSLTAPRLFGDSAKLSDLFGCATKNKLGGFGLFGGFGHSNSYLAKKGFAQTEVFADMFAVTTGPHRKLLTAVLKAFMPETFGEFQKVMS